MQGTEARSKWLEATLELGRNWALATTLAAVSVSVYSQEAVHGIALYKREILIGGIILATLWFYLATERAVQVAGFRGDTTRKRAAVYFGGLILFAVGVCITLAIPSLADNRRYVQICTDYAGLPDSLAYRDTRCQMLYEQRREVAGLLSGKVDDPDAE